MSGISRRTLIGTGVAAAGAAAVGDLVTSPAAEAAPVGPAAEAAPVGPAAQGAPAGVGRRTGTVKDVKHVVILMQENRSFDHYYGTLRGVRGFADKQQLHYPDGSTVFAQPDPKRTKDKVLLPFRMDTTKYDSQEAGDLDHSWQGTHAAWNGGAWNRWVGVKGEETMGYFARPDVPWQYALADAFTLCDQYFCSIQGPTTPNRLFLWTGTVNPEGGKGGPAISNPDDYLPVYTWTTYPERLQQAGVSWQLYANTEIGEGDWLGDYGDNPLWLFQSYHDAMNSTDPAVRQLADRAGVTPWQPDAGKGHAVDHVLQRFIADCAAGTLPTVSWVVAPYRYSEHPQARPVDGAAYTNGVLQALWANPELWESTAVLIDFDENDGFFDHVIPPFAPAGTPGEIVDGLPVGLGPRVPMTVVSPWSHGGWVNSQVFDHTSVIRFLEVVTGVHEPNISAWRRAVCGDLTSAFDFGSFHPDVPSLPDVDVLVARADAEKTLPPVPAPAPGPQPVPSQEPGSRRHRTLPYQPGGNLHGRTVTLTNAGTAAISFSVYDNLAVPFAATPVLVAGGHSGQFTVDVHDGHYDVSVYGPNGFVRAFKGTAAGGVTATLGCDALEISLGAGRFTLVGNDFVRRAETHVVARQKTVSWPVADGFYDVTVTADNLAYRFAGRIEEQRR